jgi:hypothetical protein
LKLEDQGIDHNQSARWQREAAVPNAVFEKYLAKANELRQDITAQGLLRLARILAGSARNPNNDNGFARQNGAFALRPWADRNDRRRHRTSDDSTENRHELIDEIANHVQMLEGLLKQWGESDGECVSRSEKRLVLRLLAELKGIAVRLRESSGPSP